MNDFSDPLADQIREEMHRAKQEAPPANDPVAAPAGALTLHFGLEATKPTPAHTVVRGLLHRKSVTLFYGPPKSGKSFLVTDLGLAIAGRAPSWMGHTILAAGPVLYVACEGHAGFWKRLEAAKQHHGWTDETFPHHFILATGRPALIQADERGRIFAPDASSITDAVTKAGRRGLEPVAVFVDTVFRSFGGGNVNASDHMNAYLGALSKVADLDMAVGAVHHEIKSGGTPAGSVSLIGGSDTVVHVWRKDGNRLWQVELAKDDAETEPRGFQLDVVDLGDDPEGQPASSCVVVDTGEAPEASDSGLSKQAKRAKEILADLVLAEGEPLPKGRGFPSAAAVTGIRMQKWRVECAARHLADGDGPRAQGNAFAKARKALIDNTFVCSYEEWVWLI